MRELSARRAAEKGAPKKKKITRQEKTQHRPAPCGAKI